MLTSLHFLGGPSTTKNKKIKKNFIIAQHWVQEIKIVAKLFVSGLICLFLII